MILTQLESPGRQALKTPRPSSAAHGAGPRAVGDVIPETPDRKVPGMTIHTPMDALTVSAVTLRQRHDTVLDRVDLCVPHGAVVGLVGRNGAGKSTLLRCLVGLTAPDEGHCALLGAPSLDLPDRVRECLGYVAQTPDLFESLDAAAHFQRLGALYPGWSDRRALEIAVRLDLPLGVRASRLSIGDQQKLSVVLALAHDPDLLVLDEPVAALDPTTRRNFMRAVFERREPDAPPRTVLVSSHLLTDLERVVTHVAFLRQGAVQLFDEWDAIAEHVRLLVLPSEVVLPIGERCVLHRRTLREQTRIVFDARHVNAPVPGGQALSLDDLFEELNQ